MDKYKRYRQKMISQGRCPKCGTESFPFHYCQKHRMVSNLNRALRQLLKLGVVVQNEQGEYKATGQEFIGVQYNIKENDRRKLPRFNYKPMDDKFIEQAIFDALTEAQRPLSDKDIENYFKKLKIVQKKMKVTPIV